MTIIYLSRFIGSEKWESFNGEHEEGVEVSHHTPTKEIGATCFKGAKSIALPPNKVGPFPPRPISNCCWLIVSPSLADPRYHNVCGGALLVG